jgi:glutamine synthetase adenylyltransferase
MPTLRHHTRYIFAALLALALAGCSGKKDAAQSLVWEIAATLSAAEPEAAKYIPEQLADVQTKLTDLRAAFDKKDYAGVIAAAPGVLDQAQALATAAAAKKDQILKAQNDAWTNLAAVLPDEVTALQGRLNELNSKKPVKKARSGTPKAVDLTAAGAAMTDITALWSKAQAAFAGGNLDEAVATATDVKARADALSVTL